jgi:hypothetical protein
VALRARQDKALGKVEVLDWRRFEDYDDVRKSENQPFTKPHGVYVLASPSVILYVGTAIGKTGFYGRYNARGILDAALEGTQKKLFFAHVEPSQADEIERRLIQDEVESGNRRILRHNRVRLIPNENIELKHIGDVPPFKH